LLEKGKKLSILQGTNKLSSEKNFDKIKSNKNYVNKKLLNILYLPELSNIGFQSTIIKSFKEKRISF